MMGFLDIKLNLCLRSSKRFHRKVINLRRFGGYNTCHVENVDSVDWQNKNKRFIIKIGFF